MTEREVLRNTPTGPVYKAAIPKQRILLKGLGRQLGMRRVSERFPQRVITTTGHVALDGPACVYAAVARGNRIKIGMSARRERRMEELSAKMVFCIDVVREAAKEIETYTLRFLGNGPKDGEYVSHIKPDDAIAAIKEAYRVVGGYRHVDPYVSEEQARASRIEVLAHKT